ncbi:MAG: hypothetical protein RQ839_01535 [Thermoproteus sp.]|nr:hypothetical protein [Thermoproteus sp.]MDT7880940.1 hypothetical protein [Thermoproteus sp.]
MACCDGRKRGREEAEEALRLVRDSGGDGTVVLADMALERV